MSPLVPPCSLRSSRAGGSGRRKRTTAVLESATVDPGWIHAARCRGRSAKGGSVAGLTPAGTPGGPRRGRDGSPGRDDVDLTGRVLSRRPQPVPAVHSGSLRQESVGTCSTMTRGEMDRLFLAPDARRSDRAVVAGMLAAVGREIPARPCSRGAPAWEIAGTDPSADGQRLWDVVLPALCNPRCAIALIRARDPELVITLAAHPFFSVCDGEGLVRETPMRAVLRRPRRARPMGRRLSRQDDVARLCAVTRSRLSPPSPR